MVESPDHFTERLTFFVTRAAYTPGQLETLTGVPKTTLVNWLKGRVRRPRSWRSVLAVAAALRLTEAEADQLLTAAQHATIAELRQLPTVEAEELAFWQTAVSIPPSPAPFQAIPLSPAFVGRKALLEMLTAQLSAPQHQTLYCLHGMAGSGKSSLAAQLAYRLQEAFPDGVLWARLDSSDTMSILATFAQAYRQEVSQYADLASRSRVVRALLRPKRTLIILDNAESSAQIEPLLPPTGRCAVLVTTRRQDLAALVGAIRHEIRPFSNDEAALALFAKILGETRTQAEGDALRQIATRLGHLPLALTIAASRLAYEPGWQVAQFGQRLTQTGQRMETLRYESQSVRRSFALSYELLDESVKRLFAASGRLSKQDFTPAAAAAVAEQELDEASDGLRQLYSLSLVEGRANDRFQLHPLLHDFARSLPADAEMEERVVAHWTRFVVRHANDPRTVWPEREHIELALETAVHQHWLPQLGKLINSLTPLWLAWGMHEQAEQYLQQAETLFAAAQDERHLAWVKLRLGQLERQRQQYEAAAVYLEAGLRLAQSHLDEGQTGHFLTELGILQNCLGEYKQGLTYLSEALQLARRGAPDKNYLLLLEELGILATIRGKREEMAAYYEEGYGVALSLGYQMEQVLFLKGLGAIRHLDHDWAEAQRLFEQGLTLAKGIRFTKGEMILSNNLGVVAYFLGQMGEAERLVSTAMTLTEQLNDFQAMALVLENLARWARQNGRVHQSNSYFRRLLALAKERRWPAVVARAEQQLTAAGTGRNGEAEHLRIFI